ncbi:MAG: PAS domain S-box protein [Bacteroidetes bacterium]|nr:MAG: PAS domain S-box protein [Bacteroidota bacterium]
MKTSASDIIEQYQTIFQAYLNGGGETALKTAYELGRNAIAGARGSSEFIIAHQKILEELIQASGLPEQYQQLTQSACTILAQSLSPFDMAFTGYREALSTVQRSKERYRILIETAQDMIYSLSASGTIKSLNRMFEVVTGFTREKWIGKQFEGLLHPDDAEKALAIYERVLRGETPEVFELRVITIGGEYLVAECSAAPEYHNNNVIGAFGIARDITERKKFQEQLHALTKRVVEAQEEERRSLARELHDDLTQWLSGMKLFIGLLEEQVASNKTVKNKLRRMKKQIDNKVVDVRRLSMHLRPSTLDDFGLSTALMRLCEDYQKTYRIRCYFNAKGLLYERFSAEVEIAVYRITQEALNNVVKHSKAKKARVSVSWNNPMLNLKIEDNGIGLEPAKTWGARTNGSGLGLVSMRERSELVNGIFHIFSQPGTGTRIDVDIPISREAS